MLAPAAGQRKQQGDDEGSLRDASIVIPFSRALHEDRQTVRVLLAEDNLKLADWLGKALTQSGYAVDCIHDGASADHVLVTQQYDVVILDLALPRLDGLEVLRRLRQRGARVPVLILTAKGDLDDRVQGLNLGADDYLAKPFQLAELEARIKALIRRAHGSANPQITLGPLDYDSAGRMFRLHGLPLALRPKEHAVLEVLVLRAGKVVGKESLFEKAFNIDATTNPEAVEIYVCRLRKKLDGSGVSIVTVRGLGYVLETAPAA
jgi:two-component system response regulator TctD